jgi:hypothetical protein
MQAVELSTWNLVVVYMWLLNIGFKFFFWLLLQVIGNYFQLMGEECPLVQNFMSSQLWWVGCCIDSEGVEFATKKKVLICIRVPKWGLIPQKLD